MPEQFDKSIFRGVFKIDNIDFTAGLININRKVNILDRYAERTINGDLKREILGVYYNYSLTFSQFWDTTNFSVNSLSPKSFIRFICQKTPVITNFKGTSRELKTLLSSRKTNQKGLSRG